MPAPTYQKTEYKRLIGSKAAAIEERERVKRLIRLRQPLDPQEAILAPENTLAAFLDEASRAWKKGDPRHVYADRWARWAGAEPNEPGERPRWTGGQPIALVTRPRIIEAVHQLEAQGYAGATIRIAVNALSAALTLAEDTGRIDHNPLAKPLKLPPANERDKWVPVEGMRRLIEVMGPWGIMAEFAVLSGLRCSELLGLEWQAVAGGYVDVLKTKQKKPHRVWLVGRLAEILEQQRGISPTWVFPAVKGGRWHYPAWSKKRRAWFKEAGLEGYTWHDLRHTSASYAVSSGASLPMVGEHLGHGPGSSRHTKRYAHMAEQAVQRIPEVIAGYLYSGAQVEA